jgi:hypothetical protein
MRTRSMLWTPCSTRGFSAYETLLKSYISEGLRRDEAEFDQQTARKRRGRTCAQGHPRKLTRGSPR